MSVEWKICDNCHHKVNIIAEKCPYCNNDSFMPCDNNKDSLKEEIVELYEYCELIDNRGVYDEKITPKLAEYKSNGNSVRDIVQTNLADFLTFIAIKGDSFSDKKLDFIKYNLDLEYGCDELYLMLVNNVDDNLMDYLPLSFELFYENDLFHKEFLDKKNLKGYTARLYDIFHILGKEYLECDEDTNPETWEVFKEYMDCLAKHIIELKKNSKDRKEEPKNKYHINKVLELLINCQSIGEFDEKCIANAKSWITSAIDGDENYMEFYEELSSKRPDIVTAILMSSEGNLKSGEETIQKEEESDEESLEELLDELNRLVGLEAVKKEVNSLINIIKIRKIRSERGMKQPPMSLHLVFSGNPGTGKTTVARLLSKIYAKLGVLSKGHLIETDRSGLVGGYLGQTAIKTQEVIQSAMGGILFIDEAYTLAPKRQDDAYGQEAIDTILKAMEDHRDDLIVIAAGYTELMENFISSNPGLESRFNKYILFEDYSPEELYGIFVSFCEDSSLILDKKASDYLKGLCEDLYNTRGENFANARLIRNIFEDVLTAQANRLSDESDISDEELMTILLEDFEKD